MAHAHNRLALAVILAVGACLVGVARSRMAYVFPADYDLITGQVVQQFACEGRPYGYYADVDNACRVFHICLPIQDNDGQVRDRCGEGERRYVDECVGKGGTDERERKGLRKVDGNMGGRKGVEKVYR